MQFALGVLAILIASFILRIQKEKTTPYSIAVFILFFAIDTPIDFYIHPYLDAWNNRRHIESGLLNNPTMQAIKQYDRKTYDRMLTEMVNSLKTGENEELTLGRLRNYATILVHDRISKASDEAVISLANVMIIEMDELNNQGGDLCYKYLYPQPSAPIDFGKFFSKKTQELDLSALAEVIKTSVESPQQLPQKTYVTSALAPIITDLRKEYGKDFLLILNPTGPDIDKGKICLITKDLSGEKPV